MLSLSLSKMLSFSLSKMLSFSLSKMLSLSLSKMLSLFLSKMLSLSEKISPGPLLLLLPTKIFPFQGDCRGHARISVTPGWQWWVRYSQTYMEFTTKPHNSYPSNHLQLFTLLIKRIVWKYNEQAIHCLPWPKSLPNSQIEIVTCQLGLFADVPCCQNLD